MYVLSSICANPPKAPTMLSIIWKVACVLCVNPCVKLFGSFGFAGIPPIPPDMPPPYIEPYPPIPPIPPIPPYIPEP